MKLNRKWTLVLALVLSLALATGGTLAYLQDTDSDVNVMTLGNVYIEQHEYERELDADGEYKTATIDNQTSYVLKDFTQAKPLMPIVGDPSKPGDSPAYAGWDDTITRMTQVDSYGGMQTFAGKNAQDKFVTVENTGKSDAYVRTLVAIEIGTGDADKLGTSYHQTWTENEIGKIKIDENFYLVTEYIYNGAQLDDGSWRHENGVLPAGDTTYPNLSQIYMKSEATNEDCEKLDGNGNGTLDILVVSQAVQAAGFSDAKTALDTAFGEPTAANLAAWFGGMYPETEVTSAEELEDALNNAVYGQTIKVAAGNYGTLELNELDNVTIDVQDDAAVKFNIGSDAKLTDVTLKGFNAHHVETSAAYVDGGVVNIDAGAEVKNLVIKDVDMTGEGGRSCFVGISEPTAEVTLDNVKVDGTKYLVYSSAPIKSLTVENGEFKNLSSWVILMNAGDSVGAQLTISGNTFTNCTDGIAKYLGSSQPDGAFTVFTNNTLTGCAGHDGSDAKWFAIPGSTSTITVSGNTLDGAAFTPGTAQGLGK